jgi:hypothetical protein
MLNNEDCEIIAKLDEIIVEEMAAKKAELEAKYAPEIQMFSNILQKYVYNRHKTREVLAFSINKTEGPIAPHGYDVIAVFDPKTCPEIKDLIRLRHLFYHNGEAWNTIIGKTKYVCRAQLFPEFKPCLGWFTDSCYFAPWTLKSMTLKLYLMISS